MSTEYNTEQQLIKGIINHGIDILEYSLTNDNLEKYISRVNLERLNYPIPKSKIDNVIWFMPAEYQNLDIKDYIIKICPEKNYDRVMQELKEYEKRNLLNLLRQMKYIVDTLRANSVVWGVGRGSSVASYVLFLLGVHKIDSVKYNLPLDEFFKGEEKCQQEV